MRFTRRIRPCLGRVFWTFLAGLLMEGLVQAQCPLFSENWESYTNQVKPYGEWVLGKGTWGDISESGHGGGKFYLVNKGISRIRRPVDLSGCKDIVLQGWLYDSGGTEPNKSVLGLLETTAPTQNALIRIGTGTAGFNNYTVVFMDRLQREATGGITVDTQLPVEKGWHFMRLEILHDRTVNYQVWNAAQTEEKRGTFGWVFDKTKFRFVTVGSLLATTNPVGWDDIKAGSLEEIGPAPRLPGATAEKAKP